MGYVPSVPVFPNASLTSNDGGWPSPSIADTNYKLGAPLFAHFAKGGHDAAGSAPVLTFEKISLHKQHRLLR